MSYDTRSPTCFHLDDVSSPVPTTALGFPEARSDFAGERTSSDGPLVHHRIAQPAVHRPPIETSTTSPVATTGRRPPGRRTGCNRGLRAAGCSRPRHVARNAGRWTEHHVARIAVLTQLAVDAGFDRDSGFGVEFVADQRAEREKGVEALGARPLAFFAFCRLRVVTSLASV